jgi:hypothetical protein
MAELQFERLPAKCLPQNLVTETNSKNRQTTFYQIANASNWHIRCWRSPGLLVEEQRGFFKALRRRRGGAP